MENLRLFQEPLEPAALELESLELPEDASLVYFGVVCELRAFDERKDDGVLEAVEDGPDPVQGERVFCERVVGLHIVFVCLTRCCGQGLPLGRSYFLRARWWGQGWDVRCWIPRHR